MKCSCKSRSVYTIFLFLGVSELLFYLIELSALFPKANSYFTKKVHNLDKEYNLKKVPFKISLK